jgi:hypothetical protein
MKKKVNKLTEFA